MVPIGSNSLGRFPLILVDGETRFLEDSVPGEAVLGTDQAERFSRSTSPAGSTDAVHVGLDLIGDVIVDYPRYRFHIEASCRYIGGDEGRDLLLLEALQDLEPSLLVVIAVE